MTTPFPLRRCMVSVAWALLGVNLAVGADPASDVKTDWSKFVAVNTITAEVRAVDADSVTLRVYWTEATASSSGSRGRSSSRSSRGGRNSNPLQRMIQQARSRQPNVKLHQEHHDYDVTFFADTKVTGIKGMSGPATPANLEPGMVVSALLIRDKSIPLKNMTEADFRAKSLHVTGRNPNYSPDSSSSSKPGKKK